MPTISISEQEALLETLKARFHKNMQRHPNLNWEEIAALLVAKPEKLWSINQMELTGGEPDVVIFEGDASVYYVDCAAESPKGRRSLCYDEGALKARKENKPAGSAVGMAQEMGIELLTPVQYRKLQTMGEFDLKTSSWVITPPEVRKLEGAFFGDRRFNTVFIYHNGVQSYYAGRAFRGIIGL
ncbi:MAG: DUF4256 domain-containing protein [Flexibacteraceae bacterium]